MNARLLAALLSGVVSLTAVRAQQQGAECPAAGAARLGRTWAEAAAAIQAAAQSSDDACAARALAWADLLDRRGRSACSADDRLASETDAEAPDMLGGPS